jgi:hypothetical protein
MIEKLFTSCRQLPNGEKFKNGWKMMNVVPDLKKSIVWIFFKLVF